MRKLRWGVLGAAKIALKKVVPGMSGCELSEVTAIASRDIEKARAAGLAKAYGSYEELMADPDIDVIYNPLPNHLHVPWSIKAAAAGKHVLCEKPIALGVNEAKELIAARDRYGVKIGEAFMVRTHPMWLQARELVRSGAIGQPKAIWSIFSYFNDDPKNIRNVLEYGGGGVMDIGCYPITMSRWIFGREPLRVSAVVERDPQMKVDTLASGLLDFGNGQQSVFSCSTQLAPYQRFQIFGTAGRIELEIPYNIPPDVPCRLFLNDEVQEFAAADQYGLQADAFSRAVIEDRPVPVTLEDAVANMAVIEATLRAGETGRWEEVVAR